MIPCHILFTLLIISLMLLIYHFYTLLSRCVPASAKTKPVRLEDILTNLAAGFLRGGTGFLKSSAAGEMIKGGGGVNREVRVGVTHVSIQMKSFLLLLLLLFFFFFCVCVCGFFVFVCIVSLLMIMNILVSSLIHASILTSTCQKSKEMLERNFICTIT